MKVPLRRAPIDYAGHVINHTDLGLASGKPDLAAHVPTRAELGIASPGKEHFWAPVVPRNPRNKALAQALKEDSYGFVDAVADIVVGTPCDTCGKKLGNAYSVDYEKGNVWCAACSPPRARSSVRSIGRTLSVPRKRGLPSASPVQPAQTPKLDRAVEQILSQLPSNIRQRWQSPADIVRQRWARKQNVIR